MKKNSTESYTIKTHEHKCSYAYKFVCFENDKYSKPVNTYRGKDAVYKFFEDMFEEEKQIDEYMREFYKTKMIMNQNDWSQYNHAKTCYVCHQSFTRDFVKLEIIVMFLVNLEVQLVIGIIHN